MKKFLISLMLAVTFIIGIASAEEEDAYDFSTDSTIKMTCMYDKTPIKGVEFSLYRISYAEVNNTALDGSGDDYVFFYNKVGANYERNNEFDDMTAIQMYEYAKKCDAAKLEFVAKATSDEKGVVEYKLDTMGMYLVMQTNTLKEYSTYDPFLLSIPTEVGGELIYSLDIAPKTKVTESDTDENYPPDKDKGNPPDKDKGFPPATGDNMNVFMYVMLALVSLIVVGVSYKEAKKK